MVVVCVVGRKVCRAGGRSPTKQAAAAGEEKENHLLRIVRQEGITKPAQVAGELQNGREGSSR